MEKPKRRKLNPIYNRETVVGDCVDIGFNDGCDASNDYYESVLKKLRSEVERLHKYTYPLADVDFNYLDREEVLALIDKALGET